jgi:hypothetical protein
MMKQRIVLAAGAAAMSLCLAEVAIAQTPPPPAAAPASPSPQTPQSPSASSSAATAAKNAQTSALAAAKSAEVAAEANYQKDLKAFEAGTGSADALTTDQKAVMGARQKVDQLTPIGSSNPVCFDRIADLSWCMVTGAMAIPFRAELTGKKDVLGGVSADLFVGVNLTGFANWLGVSSDLAPTVLVYAGYLPSLSSSNSGTSTSSGSGSGSGAVDFGLGFAVPVYDVTDTKVVHAGVVIGFNVTSGANKFAYNGKPYISAFAALSF